MGRSVSTCPGLRQYWIEKSGQMPFKIYPAQLADSDDPVWAEAGFFSSYGHPHENVTRVRAFFSTSMTTEYSRAHTAFRLHLTFSCGFPSMREPKLRSAGSRAEIGIRKHLLRTIGHANMHFRIGFPCCSSFIMTPQPNSHSTTV